MEYTLKYPIERSSKDGSIEKINIRERLKVADMLEIDEKDIGDIECSVRLIMRLCKLSRSEVEGMDIDDMNAIANHISLLKNSPTREDGE